MLQRRNPRAAALAGAIVLGLSAPGAFAACAPCAPKRSASAKNPCAPRKANPCAAKNPCATKSPCAAKAKPRAGKSPCAAKKQ